MGQNEKGSDLVSKTLDAVIRDIEKVVEVFRDRLIKGIDATTTMEALRGLSEAAMNGMQTELTEMTLHARHRCPAFDDALLQMSLFAKVFLTAQSDALGHGSFSETKTAMLTAVRTRASQVIDELKTNASAVGKVSDQIMSSFENALNETILMEEANAAQKH